MPYLLLLFVLAFLAFGQEIRVSTIVQGRVDKVYVKEGQKVKKGQVLVRVDPVLYTTQRDNLKAQLRAQEINLQKVERDFRRYEELFNRGLLSKSEYEDWKSKYEKEKSLYDALRAQLERVEKLIEYCTISAPTDGKVKKLFVREGMFVNGTTQGEVLLILEEQ